MSEFIKPHTIEGWEHLCGLQTERICELTVEVERLKADSARVVARHGWHPADGAPPVKKGEAKQFIVAVRRGHDGKVYSFAATYLNAMGLVYEDERPVEADGEEEGLTLTTGWHEEKDHDSFDTAYFPLGLDHGRDTLVGWMGIPQWSDVELNEHQPATAFCDHGISPDHFCPECDGPTKPTPAMIAAAEMHAELVASKPASEPKMDVPRWQPVAEPPQGHYISRPEQPVFAWGGGRYHPQCYVIQLPPLPDSAPEEHR